MVLAEPQGLTRLHVKALDFTYTACRAVELSHVLHHQNSAPDPLLGPRVWATRLPASLDLGHSAGAVPDWVDMQIPQLVLYHSRGNHGLR